MRKLSDILLGSDNRSKLISEFSNLVESTVAAKTGIKGGLIKTGFKMVKSVKSGFVTSAVTKLLPDFVGAIEPHFVQWDQGDKATSFADTLAGEKADVAKRLIEVTDKRVANASGIVKKTYKKLRNSAEAEVQAVTPAIGKIVGRFL